MEQYFDKDYNLILKLVFHFSNESRDTNNYGIITQSKIFEYLIQAEKKQNELITQTNFFQYQPNSKKRFISIDPQLESSSYYFSLYCKKSNFPLIFDSILDLLIEDFEGALMLSLKCDISFELFMEYKNGASVKITKEQLQKYRILLGGSISLESTSSQEYHEIEDNHHTLLCFITPSENNDDALKKVKDSWNFLFSGLYSNYQKIEYHTMQETNQIALVIGIREDDDISMGWDLYLDLLAFVRAHHSFLARNDIEANWIALHRFYSSGEIAAEKIAELNANLVIIKSYTETFPPFEEIYKLL